MSKGDLRTLDLPTWLTRSGSHHPWRATHGEHQLAEVQAGGPQVQRTTPKHERVRDRSSDLRRGRSALREQQDRERVEQVERRRLAEVGHLERPVAKVAQDQQ